MRKHYTNKCKVKKEIHLQFSGCSWNAIPVMCYVALTTVVFVGNLTISYRTCTATPMIAICKMNPVKIRQLMGRFFKKAVHFYICINTVLITNLHFYLLSKGETKFPTLYFCKFVLFTNLNGLKLPVFKTMAKQEQVVKNFVHSFFTQMNWIINR